MNRLIKWNRTQFYLEAFGAFVPCSCPVRSLANGLRKRNEIVYTMPGNLPYDPQPFPLGTWNVLKPRARTDKYRAPWFIPTDACQEVEIWQVENGEYKRPWLEKFAVDSDYGLHYSEDDHTFGCIKIGSKEDIVWLVDRIEEFMSHKDSVQIEVTES